MKSVEHDIKEYLKGYLTEEKTVKNEYSQYMEIAEESIDELFGSDLSNVGLTKEEVKLMKQHGVNRVLDLFPGKSNLEDVSDKDIKEKVYSKLKKIKGETNEQNKGIC